MTDSDPDVRWMTYAEAATALRVNPESVAKRVRRRGWARRLGNDNEPRVAVPVSVLPSVPVSVPETTANTEPYVPDIDRDRNFAEAIAALREGHHLVQVQLEAMRLQQAVLVSQLDHERERVKEAEARAMAAEVTAEAARARVIEISQRLGGVEAEANAARLAAARAGRDLEQAEAARQTAEIKVASAEASTAEAEVHAAEAEREAKELRLALAEARRPFWRRWLEP